MRTLNRKSIIEINKLNEILKTSTEELYTQRREKRLRYLHEVDILDDQIKDLNSCFHAVSCYIVDNQ